ncbi:hypothetical protein V1477_013922 [Vespula maculifrons]|uniref:Uncharacterized protein n=1 Tax=Vespula maculifrons TaxID=7453 RepID=A0ABD2BPY5_VESMC
MTDGANPKHYLERVNKKFLFNLNIDNLTLIQKSSYEFIGKLLIEKSLRTGHSMKRIYLLRH